MKIFLVEDDSELNEILRSTLASLSHEVTSFVDGNDALNNIDEKYDLYIVDINLPNINGFELIKAIKYVNNNANIFVISGNNKIETILKAYDIGCSDFIKKPFDIREILAKIDYTIRRSPKNIKITNECEYCNNEKKIIYNDKETLLTNKEVLLLNLLLDNKNKLVSNAIIESHIWGISEGEGYVKQLVSKLKNKLPKGTIKNKSMHGYKIVLD